MSDVVTLSITGHVALITLNRPEQLNTYTAAMGEQWNAAYAACEANDDVRVIVVTGAGRAFCAGADMSGGASTFDKQDDMAFSSCPVTPAWRLKKPVIAAVNGHAIGIGFGLALQCDFRVVAEEAKYGLVQVRRGVLADCGSHWLLPRLVGVEKAMQLLVMARTLKGNEVMAMGLASACVPSAQVLDEALRMAHELATHCAPAVAAMTKQLIWRSLDQSLQQALATETAVLHHTMGQHDAMEGGLAFVEKRLPQWQGSVSHDWPGVLSSD
ncbi:MAG: crotonase [Gammaproteobacteria bacterium]|nr:MAG: crotonase [Gammaproteobacteria bacterium]